MRFEFATATRIIFGSGTLKDIGPIAARLGNRALLVTGSRPERADPLEALLHAAGVHTTVFPVSREPDVATIKSGIAAARLDPVVALSNDQ